MIDIKRLENKFMRLPDPVQIYLNSQWLSPEQISVRAIGRNFRNRRGYLDDNDYETIREESEELCNSEKSKLNCNEYLREVMSV
jgi:hypothetical protein